MVGGGFEPPKASPTDLQSVPFDRSGTPPIYIVNGGLENTDYGMIEIIRNPQSLTQTWRGATSVLTIDISGVSIKDS